MSVIFATQFSIEKTKQMNNKYWLILEKSIKIYKCLGVGSLYKADFV